MSLSRDLGELVVWVGSEEDREREGEREGDAVYEDGSRWQRVCLIELKMFMIENSNLY